jgi:serine/threonine protein kinase
MSPEHVKGFSYTDHRSDIYSIGMTFYEMITGNVPFKNLDSDFDIREMIVRKEMATPTSFNKDIPEAVEKIIMKAIAKAPDDRYQSCEAMISDLEMFEKGVGIPKETKPPKEEPVVIEEEKVPSDKKSLVRQWWWAAMLPVLLLLYFIIWGLPGNNDEAPINEVSLSSLEIKTQPTDALVLFNNDTLDSNERKGLKVSAGTYAIVAEMEGFTPKDTLVTISENEESSIAIVLNKLKPVENEVVAVSPISTKDNSEITSERASKASLSISSVPSEASIWINNEKRGTTPLNLDQLEPGSYIMQIRKDGFEEYQETIVLSEEGRRTVQAELMVESGLISISTTPPGAIVKIDGRDFGNGTTPLSGKRLPLGTHNISVSLSGFETIEEEIIISKDQSNNLDYNLIAQNGNLIVRVRPWGSVYINNQLKKATTDFKFEIELPAVNHLLKVTHPTLGFWEREIKIKPNSDLTIDVNFNKKIPVSVVAYDTEGNPVQAEIMLNSKPTGELTPREISLRTGLHRLSVIKDGYIAVEGEKDVLIDESLIETQKFILQKIE